MSETDFDLEKLLAPVGRETFFRDHLERQPLHIARRGPDYYAGLLSLADVEQVIAFTRPVFPDSSAFSQEPAEKKTYVQGWLAERVQPTTIPRGISGLQEVYAQGKTVVLMTMQHRWLPLAVLCRNLEGVFHCPVHANLYLTPKGAKGFEAHFDCHEVLVLQLEGHKHWRLYGPARRLPLVDERFPVAIDSLGPAREVHLAPGDLLYLPRGHVHEAFTSEEPSLHVTVGINVYRWVDLFREALAELARDDERFREAIPPGRLDGQPPGPDLRQHFAELVDRFCREARLEAALSGLGDQFFENLEPLPGGHLAAPREEEIDLDTVVERRPGAICRVLQEGGWVEIEFPGGKIGGPAKIAAALQFIALHPRFAVGSLPDDLGPEAKRVLVRRLLKGHLLRVATQPVREKKSRSSNSPVAERERP